MYAMAEGCSVKCSITFMINSPNDTAFPRKNKQFHIPGKYYKEDINNGTGTGSSTLQGYSILTW